MTITPQNSTVARKARRSPQVASWVGTLLMVLLLVVALTPVLWAVVSSFKSRADIFAAGFWPQTWTFENYRLLLENTRFGRWTFNSFLVSALSTVLGLLLCALGGYGFAKFDFWGKGFLFTIVMLSVSIPAFTTVTPLFGWLAKLGLLNTYTVLILPFAANAFGVFLMRQYFAAVPNELLDSGRIDGCSEMRLFFNIVLPLVRPGLGTVGVLIFLASWNSYIWPLVLMRSEDMYTLPVGVATLKGDQLVEYGQLMAASILSSLPIIVAYLLMQRQFVAGITDGAVKG